MTPELVAQSGHVLAGAVVAIAVLSAYRWVRRQSPLVAGVMAFGILARAAIGLALFWISYLDSSFLRGLHTGDGFWALAPDAGTYYYAAIRAYFDGMSAIPAGTPSPAFVQLLTGWMHLVGPSPASALFLNLCLFALLCVLVVKICRPAVNHQGHLACAACLAPFSIAPALLIHGSQPLKDEAFVFLIALTCLSVMTLLRVSRFDGRSGTHPRTTVVPLAGLGAAAYLIAGIRLYYAGLVLTCLAIAIVVYLWRARSVSPARAVAVGLACLTVATAGPACVAMQGNSRSSLVAAFSVLRAPAPLSADPSISSGGITFRKVWASGTTFWNTGIARLRWARYQFALTGGGSNVAASGRTESAVRATLVGLALVVVPISIVKGLGWVDFPGGRGLLAVTDIDTVLLDLSLLACVVLLFARRKSIGQNAAYICYGLALALVTAVLLSYVVTNFGTLFRLRLLIAAPLWMLPLAACYRLEAGATILEVPVATRIEPAVMPRTA